MFEAVEPSLQANAMREIADCKARFAAGDYRFAIHALRWATMFRLPLPDWLADEAQAAMAFAFEHGGAKGKGKTGGHKKRQEREAMHRERYRVAAWQLDRRRVVGGNRQQAFERASELLAGTPARGSAGEIEKSYNRLASRFAPKGKDD